MRGERDSKKISVWDQNLMVEWHARYKGHGVLTLIKKHYVLIHNLRPVHPQKLTR